MEQNKVHKRKKSDYENPDVNFIDFRKVNEARQFYNFINNDQKDFTPMTNMCRDSRGIILTAKTKQKT